MQNASIVNADELWRCLEAMKPAVALLALLAFGGCSRSNTTTPPLRQHDAQTPTPSAAPSPSPSPLRSLERSVADRRYLELSAPSGRLALRLERPKQSDAKVWLAVPGTYTSPDGGVEGAVVLNGRVRSTRRQHWEALLVIDQQGAAEIRRVSGLKPSDLDAVAAEHASAIQGHLLVFDHATRPLKPSPALRRRALGTVHGAPPAIVESLEPVPLAEFASDLVALGFERAMNLDMGGWSEGWYRAPGGKLAVLGEDFSDTARQSNWLTFEAR